MSFFTSAQLFGDGGGFGPQVPISLSNPAGYGAANRGIGFGEQLTSAIANRSHYALALNTDDLNTRLALFETSGLDAAYRLGAAAVAGGGRVITKNGGAVETTSTLAAQYADDIADAHFRANTVGDVSPGGGFDHRASRQTANPLYGFMSRSNVNAAVANSNIGYSEAATLNPGSIGGDIVRFTSATAYTGANTDVALGVDMVEISGAAVGVNGLYYIYSFGPTTADFHLRRLDGTTPAFAAGTSVTIKLFRWSMMAPMRLPVATASLGVQGMSPSDTTTLGVFTHDLNGYLGTGTIDALSFIVSTITGSPLAKMAFSGAGQLYGTLSSSMFGTYADTEMRLRGGIRNLFFDHSGASAGSHEVGMIFKDASDTPTARAAVENWQRITETTILGIQPSINGTFAAPTGRILLPDSDGTPAPPTGLAKWTWSLAVTPGVTAIEMLTGGAAGQIYLLQKVVLTGTGPSDTTQDEIVVTDLDGGTPSLPTAGSFTFRFLSRDVFAYKMPPSQLASSPDPVVSPGNTVTYGHVFGGQFSTATRTRAIGVLGDVAGFGIDQTNAAGDHYLQETWKIASDGYIYTLGRMTAAGVTLSTDTSISTPNNDVTISLDLRIAQPQMDAAGAPLWRFDRTNHWWECIALDGATSDACLYFPIPYGGQLRTTTVQAFAAAGSLHSVFAALQITAPVWGTPASAPTITNANEATIVIANGAWGENFISHGLGSGTSISYANNFYAFRIRAQAVGDRVRALRSVVRYTGLSSGM